MYQALSDPQRPHSWLRHASGNVVLVSRGITLYIYTRNNCTLLYINKITVLRELVSPLRCSIVIQGFLLRPSCEAIHGASFTPSMLQYQTAI